MLSTYANIRETIIPPHFNTYLVINKRNFSFFKTYLTITSITTALDTGIFGCINAI
jgi:hypothetical protein